jgi:transcription antitermination protein NusB
MISRRLLRVKILQVLYATNSKQDQVIGQSEKELFFSINKSYDLYFLLLLLPIELVRLEEQRIDTARQKLMPSFNDLHPSNTFIQNKHVSQLKSNLQLVRYISENKINWVNNFEVVKNLLNIIREKEYFNEYLSLKNSSYEDDKAIILKIIEEEIPVFSALENTLEELSIFWNDDMDFILSMVFKTLKSFKQSDGPDKKLMPLFKNDDDLEFVKKLFHKVCLNCNEYNDLIKAHSQNWEFDRIAIMDILIMRMALAEIMEFPSIPIKVSLNEYIEIAKDYSTSNSNTFINGILDNVVKYLKKENKIVKTGRGLIET